MQLRLAFIGAALCSMTYGCATEQPTQGQAAAAPQSSSSGIYRTGSRLPSYDSDGSSSTGAVSKDDYNDQMNRTMKPGQAN
jgi:transcription elongation factor